MLVIARNNHIAVPYRSTNTTAVHKAVSIASSLSALLSGYFRFMLFTRLMSLLVRAGSVVR